MKGVECEDCGHEEDEYRRYCPKCDGDMRAIYEFSNPEHTKSDKV